MERANERASTSLALGLLTFAVVVPACATPRQEEAAEDRPPASERGAFASAPVPASAPAVARPAAPSSSPVQGSKDAVLDRLLERARRDGSVRAMVQLHVLEEVNAFDVDRIRAEQDRFLDLLARARQDERGLTRCDRIPYLALELTEQDLLDLKAQGPEVLRDFGIGVDVLLFEKSAPAAAADYSLADVVASVQADVAAAAGYDGSGQTIVLVDTGLDPGFYLLAERIAGGSFQTTGLELAVCTESGETAWRGDPAHGAVAPPSLGLSHGTQVATVACAAHPTDAALRGVAPGASVVSIRLDDSAGIPTSMVVQGVLEVLCYWGGELGLDVAAVSISLGSEDAFACPCGTDSASLGEIGPAAGAMKFVIGLLAERGIPVVVGAGNDGAAGMSFPACLESAVSVVATEGKSGKLTWSNWDATADLSAPGATILVPREGTGTMLGLGPGTSIAAPVVAGAIAVLRGAYPGCGTDVILDALRASTVTLPPSSSTSGTTMLATTTLPPVPFVQIEEARAYLAEVCGGAEPTP